MATRVSSQHGTVVADEHQFLLQDGPIPLPRGAAAVGALRFDDGTTLVFRRGHVVRSAPDTDYRVRNGEVDSAVMNDPLGGVAPAHFELSAVAGGQVEVRDLGSPGGTFIAHAGATDWKRLDAGVGAILADGVRIGFGRRTAVFRAEPSTPDPEVAD